MSGSLDDRDHRLLMLLESDGRMPVSELARAVKLSRTAVRQRMTRLERDGVIRGYTVKRGDIPEDEGLKALITLVLDGVRCADLVADLEGLPELRAYWSLAGEQDAAVLFHVASRARLREISALLAADHRIVRTRSHLILDTFVER